MQAKQHLIYAAEKIDGLNIHSFAKNRIGSNKVKTSVDDIIILLLYYYYYIIIVVVVFVVVVVACQGTCHVSSGASDVSEPL